MKRTISVILAVVMLSAVLGAPLPAASRADEPALPFRDVSEGDWFFEAVAYVYEHGIMVGVTGDLGSKSLLTSRMLALDV